MALTTRNSFFLRRLLTVRLPPSIGSFACAAAKDGSPPAAKRNIFAATSIPAASTSRCYSSNSNSGEDHHKLFGEQMAELNEEREALFGTPDDPDENIDDIKVKAEQITNQMASSNKKTGSVENEMQILKDERQQLYGFTEQEELAWSNAGGAKHKHHASFLRNIEQARRQVDEQLLKQEELKQQFIQQHQNHQRTQESTPSPTSSSSYSTSPNSDDNKLTHVSQEGAVHMVDVGHKIATRRTATAETVIVFPDEVLDAFLQQPSNNNTSSNSTSELVGPKGPIFATAKIAGILAAKQTSNLIPLCHPLPLEQVEITVEWRSRNAVAIRCQCRVTHKTGVEMEALTGASVAALTVYDMVKAVSHDVVLQQTRLLHKDGGKWHVDKR